FYCYRDPLDLLSFPTRRSSDLIDHAISSCEPPDDPAPLDLAAARLAPFHMGRHGTGLPAARLPAGAGPTARHGRRRSWRPAGRGDRKSTRLNSSHVKISYAVFC